MIIAHKSNTEIQTLKEHSQNVANKASKFLDGDENAYIAGMYHDTGKASNEFQRKIINNSNDTVDHSTAGMQLLCKHKDNFLADSLIGAVIAGHHTGLPDYGTSLDTESDSTICGRLKKNIPDFSNYKSELNEPNFDDETKSKLLSIACAKMDECSRKNMNSFSLFIYAHMLFSAVTDADFLDTEHFFGKLREDEFDDIKTISKRIIEEYKSFSKCDTEINKCRTEIANKCFESGKNKRGLFFFKVPPGAGKTRASLLFASNHVLNNNMDRIIYCIPYTSIIEQNANVFKSIIGDKNVLEHHSAFDIDEHKENISEKQIIALKNATENWDCPFIVTTNVQFANSFYSNKSSANRKLHNIRNSVIIFDEIQAIPIEYTKAFMMLLNELIKNYNCSIVLCSATQPPFLNDKFFSKEIIKSAINLCPETENIDKIFKRADVEHIGNIRNDDDFAKMISKHEQCIVICNNKKHVANLYSKVKKLSENKNKNIFQLTTLFCPYHRTKIIYQIKKCLRDNEPIILITTKLIEAGVDIDFPIGYKEEDGADSIEQAKGRINRDGKRINYDGTKYIGKLYIFKFIENNEYNKPLFPAPKSICSCIDAFNITRNVFKNPDINSDDFISKYYNNIFATKNIDESDVYLLASKSENISLHDGICKFNFAEISQKFKYIDAKTNQVIIPLTKECEDIVNKIRLGIILKSDIRKLSKYTVSLYDKDFNEYKSKGLLDEIAENIFVLSDMNQYNEYSGLSINPTFEDAIYL